MSFAQTWEWACAAGGDQYGGAIRRNNGTGICVDNAGNVYVSGNFSGKAVFGKDTLNSYTDVNPLVIKYNAAGKAEWARQITRGMTDFATGICVDAEQNICVVGAKSGRTMSPYVAKYNSKGVLLWLNEYDEDAEYKATGDHTSYARAVAANRSGDIYVAGDCKGVAYFDKVVIGAHNKYTVFLVKYNRKGKMVWVRSSTPAENHYNEASCVVVDDAENVYMAGEYHGYANFDGLVLSGKGEADVFVVKYDKEGKAGWAKTYGGAKSDRPRSMVADSKGNIFLTAYFAEPFTENETRKSVIGENLMKLSSTGNFIWNKQIGVADKDYLISSYAAVDKNGYIYLTGNTYGAIPLLGNKSVSNKGASDIFVAKCSPDGEKIWLTQMGGSSVDEGAAICVDNAFSVYVTGYFHNKLTLGAHTIQAKSNDDGIFVGKIK